MTLKQTQPKPGHLRGVSVNKTKRTGRSDGHVQVQPKPGHLRGVSKNPTGRGGSVPEQGPVKGYKNKVSSRGISPKGIGDGVVR